MSREAQLRRSRMRLTLLGSLVYVVMRLRILCRDLLSMNVRTK
jgi:hypothetical protein